MSEPRRLWRTIVAPGASRPVRLVFALAVALGAVAVVAHEGHDHEPALTLPVAGDAPARLSDGSVRLVKRSQRQIGLRTLRVSSEAHARAVTLVGVVANDPSVGGKVQPTLGGRVEAPPGGFPAVGARVARGQVLALVRVGVDPVQQAAQASLIAELTEARKLAASRLTRLRELSESVPRKDIEAADSELASLDARLRASAAGRLPVETLVAPVDGVIASARAMAGQVVDAREPLFEIVAPGRLLIEASAYDAALAAAIVDGSLNVGGVTVPLTLVGVGRVLRDQAVPVSFRASATALSALSALSVGQAVQVIARLRDTASGIALPAAALTRNAANLPVVWVKRDPERFEPRAVRAQPLDAGRVLITDGLAPDERVVTVGAALLGQIR